MEQQKFSDIDSYIKLFPGDTGEKLQKVRETIRRSAPTADEAISYGMPTFKLYGNLVHFAAFKNHIGFYPIPEGIEAFKKDLEPYKKGKGSVQFPLDQEIPYELISRIVGYRVQQNLAKAQTKSKKG